MKNEKMSLDLSIRISLKARMQEIIRAEWVLGRYSQCVEHCFPSPSYSTISHGLALA